MEQKHLENLIYECSEKKLEEIKQIIPKMNKTWVQKLILYASNSNPLSFKLLGEIFKLTGEAQIKLSKWNVFSHYLYVSEITQYEDFDEGGRPNIIQLKRPSLYVDLIPEESVWSYLKSDDIDKFTNYIIDKNIQLLEIEEEDNDELSDDCIEIIKNKNGKINDLLVNYNSFNMIEFACYCDSIKIVKFLVNEKVPITNHAILNSIKGGSRKVIDYFVSKDISFDNMLTPAIESHQNKIAKWLYENYSDNQFNITCCVRSFNTEMLLYFLDNQIYDINEVDSFHKSCLHFAISNNDMYLAYYLIHKGINSTLRDSFDKTAFDYAESKEIQT